MSSVQEAVDQAITSRMSARAFTAQAVTREMITGILDVARRSPSGTNTQPWKVYVLQGASRDSLVEKVCAAHDAIRANPAVAEEYREAYDYYPTQWVSPYIDRRRENGWSLYGLLGIGKADKDKMHLQHQRNFKFFDAPVGLMFTLDRVMGRGSLLDYGMFLQSIMVAARARLAHLSPSSLEWVLQNHPAAHWCWRERNAGLRHGTGLGRWGGQGEHLGDAARAGRVVHPLVCLKVHANRCLEKP